ncbi:prophage antirepressor [Acetobacter senegalensis DSM 18889]|nr:prophage antirepressor [Acetobacter senegalensis DSM 18889]
MSNIIPFNFEDHAVRVITRDGEPWFVLADVCDVLEHTNSRVVADRLEDDERGVSNVYTLGGPQDMSIINESGLYNLIFTSRKPEAKRFRKWVTGEVLPAIRKTGSYALPTDKQEWFSRFARVLGMWDTLGESAAEKEWHNIGMCCPMPRKAGVKILMEATLDMPTTIAEATSLKKIIANRHNAVFSGRPRKGETAAQAKARRFHMVEKEICPSDDGKECTVITYATHPEQQTNP